MTGRIFKTASLALVMFSCLSGITATKGLCDEDTEGGTGTMQILSDAFTEGATIPMKHTCEGEDVSPSLSISGIPGEAKSLVLICDDPDAPVGTWVHWVLFGLSPETTELPEGVPDDAEVLGGAKHGRNDFGNLGYGGPCPPPGPAHRYYFKVYAIDMELALSAGANKADVMSAIEGHVLDETQIMGRYGR